MMKATIERYMPRGMGTDEEVNQFTGKGSEKVSKGVFFKKIQIQLINVYCIICSRGAGL